MISSAAFAVNLSVQRQGSKRGTLAFGTTALVFLCTTIVNIFGWVEGNPIKYLLRFILFGEGDIPVVTHEVLRKAEKHPSRRPVIHVGG